MSDYVICNYNPLISNKEMEIGQNFLTSGFGGIYPKDIKIGILEDIKVIDSNNIELTSFTSGVTTSKIVFDLRSASISVKESHAHQNKIIKSIDLLGRDLIDNNLLINIYDDGSLEKKYILK